GNPGDKRPVGSELVVLDVAGEGNVAAPAAAAAAVKAGAASPRSLAPTLSSPAAGGRAAEAAREKPPRSIPGQAVGPAGKEAEAEGEAAKLVSRQPGDKPLASPAVRRRAWDIGVPLQFVPGTGPGGRITREDLDAYAGSPATPAATPASAAARRDGVE